MVITANPAGLNAGIYTGTVTLTYPASPIRSAIPVTLAIWDKEPVLAVTPPSVTFTIPLDDAYQMSHSLQFPAIQCPTPPGPHPQAAAVSRHGAWLEPPVLTGGTPVRASVRTLGA